MFNPPLEEDKSMMQKLRDRCDTNKFLVHFQPVRTHIIKSITDFHCSSRNHIYFKENKFSFASEQDTKATLTEDSMTSFWGPNSFWKIMHYISVLRG